MLISKRFTHTAFLTHYSNDPTEGSHGLLLKDLAIKLEKFMAFRKQVSRSIRRMNKHLEKEFGENVVEKRGWHWAMTSFAFKSWGKSMKEMNNA